MTVQHCFIRDDEILRGLVAMSEESPNYLLDSDLDQLTTDFLERFSFWGKADRRYVGIKNFRAYMRNFLDQRTVLRKDGRALLLPLDEAKWAAIAVQAPALEGQLVAS